jgi:hypothetical protein
MARLRSENTKVPVVETQRQIDVDLARYGCSSASFVSEPGREIIRFTRRGNREVKWIMPVPVGSGRKIDQEIKACWRSVRDNILLRLDAIARRIELWEQSFMAHVVNPKTGKTLYEELHEQLQLPPPPPPPSGHNHRIQLR